MAKVLSPQSIPNQTQPLPSVPPAPAPADWQARLAKLAPRIAERAARHDETDTFVADNFQDLKEEKFFSVGVPAEFGGGNASFAELCEIVRLLAHSCGSTSLALSMHYHLLAGLVWKWRHLGAPLEPLLKRVAKEELILVSTGGADWLHSSGLAEKVEGGFRVTARKIFASASPVGDLLLTSAVHDDPQAGGTVLHFAVPLKAPEVTIASNWRTLGMRGTGSNDIMINGFFVPESSIVARRPRGKWHPALYLAGKMALPMVFCTYVGLAEAAVTIALREVRPKSSLPETQFLAGEMESELFALHLAHKRIVELGAEAAPGPQTTNGIVMARTMIARSAIKTIELAMQLVGGRSFYRELGLERLYRDVQGARFHPLPEKAQHQFTGRLALGLDLDAN